VKIKQYFIAIVDDDEDDRDILAATFRENYDNASVKTFQGGDELLDVLKSGVTLPNLIITDLYMPRFTGVDLIMHMKKDPRIAHIPVVLLSTIKNEKAIQEISVLEDVYYFVKPNNLIDYSLMADAIINKLLPVIRKE